MIKGESPEKRIKKQRGAGDGPSKLPYRQICINLSHCKYSIHNYVCRDLLGWRIIKKDPDNRNCDIVWHDYQSSQQFLGRLRCHQKMNHFPGIEGLARKNFLGYNLNSMKKEFPDDYNFFPDTFCLPADSNKLYSLYHNHNKIPTHIVKPESSAQGKGIYLIKKFDQIPFGENKVLQRYLDNPFLLDGFKFDMRIYVLVTCIDPLVMYIFEDGIARLGTHKYSKPTSKNIQNQFQHITNYAIQKHSGCFQFSQDPDKADTGHKRSLKSVWKALKMAGKTRDYVWSQIKDLSIKSVISILPQLQHRYNSTQPNDISGGMCFEILGLDVILDDNFKAYLLEVNHAPSFNSDTPFDKKNKCELLYGAFKIIQCTLQNRREIIKREKKMIQQRIKSKHKTCTKKQEIKEQFRKRYDIDVTQWKYEKIYPVNSKKDYYETFYKFSLAKFKRKTEAFKKPKNQDKENQILNFKNSQKKIKLTTQQRHQMILNSIRRLYKPKKVQSIFKPKPKRQSLKPTNSPKIHFLKTNKVTINFDLQFNQSFHQKFQNFHLLLRFHLGILYVIKSLSYPLHALNVVFLEFFKDVLRNRLFYEFFL